MNIPINKLWINLQSSPYMWVTSLHGAEVGCRTVGHFTHGAHLIIISELAIL
jgi:hypothetical protein